jgi:hypothetical protein
LEAAAQEGLGDPDRRHIGENAEARRDPGAARMQDAISVDKPQIERGELAPRSVEKREQHRQLAKRQ